MKRMNLTLDDDTFAQLDRHAKRLGKPSARAVKDLLVEGLARHATRERHRRLARDYAAGRADARAVLHDLESGQFDLLDDDERA